MRDVGPYLRSASKRHLISDPTVFYNGFKSLINGHK